MLLQPNCMQTKNCCSGGTLCEEQVVLQLMFLLVCVKKTLSVSQVSSSSFWFVWRTPVCSSSLVIFRLVCVKETRLFLKSRHLPSGLCGQNLSVSQISSSSFWFVWGKPVCFSSLVLFLLVCVKKTVSVSQLPSEVSFYNSDWRNQVCLGVMVSISSSSSWCSCWKDVRMFVRVLKGFLQSWLFLNYWTILIACNNRSREVVPEEGSGLLGSTSSVAGPSLGKHTSGFSCFWIAAHY